MLSRSELKSLQSHRDYPSVSVLARDASDRAREQARSDQGQEFGQQGGQRDCT